MWLSMEYFSIITFIFVGRASAVNSSSLVSLVRPVNPGNGRI